MPHRAPAPAAGLPVDPTRRTALKVLGVAAAALAAGCGGGASVEAIYSLSPITSAPGTSATRAQLLVPVPAALSAIATERIAVKPTPISLSYYPQVAWADTVPRVFQVLLLESLQNTNRVKAVGLPGQSLLIDYQIVSEIRAFWAEVFAADVARVTVAVKILNDRNGQVVAERVFDRTAPIASTEVTDVVLGIETAAKALIEEIVAFVLATV